MVRATAPVALAATPDRRRSLADGVLVEASVRARLLGLRILRLDGTVVLAPADVTGFPHGARAAPAPPSPRPAKIGATTRAAPTGRRLTEAVQSINEGAELLEQTRRDGS